MVLLEHHQTQLDMREIGNFTFISISSLISLSIIMILAVSILFGSLMGSTLGIKPSETSVTYGCVPISGGLHCDIGTEQIQQFYSVRTGKGNLSDKSRLL